MKIAFIISITIIIIAVNFYPQWSYKQWYKRCKRNSEHPDFVKYSGKRYLTKEEYYAPFKKHK